MACNQYDKKIIDERAVLRSLSLPNLLSIWHLSSSQFRAASPRCSVAHRGWWAWGGRGGVRQWGPTSSGVSGGITLFNCHARQAGLQTTQLIPQTKASLCEDRLPPLRIIQRTCWQVRRGFQNTSFRNMAFSQVSSAVKLTATLSYIAEKKCSFANEETGSGHPASLSEQKSLEQETFVLLTESWPHPHPDGSGETEPLGKSGHVC